MEYNVNVIATCESDIWTTDTEQFPATVKNLISGLNVDYRFKIVSAGAQRSSWDSDDLLTVSRHFSSGLKASFTVDSLNTVQSFENSLASACSKLDATYKLKVRMKTKEF